MDPRNYHAEIMDAYAAGDAKRLATLASELAGELAAVTSLKSELHSELDRMHRQNADRQQRWRNNRVTLRNAPNVTVLPPLDGPPFSSPDPTKSLPLIPSNPIHVTSPNNGAATSVPGGANRKPHNDYPEEFEAWWGDYPSDGRGTKTTAYKAWKARQRDGHTREIMVAGLTRYKAYLAATGRYPKNASTFLGPDLHFLETWNAPPSLLNGGKPRGNSADDEVARNKALGARIDERRRKADGEEWWAWAERAAKMRGAHNHRDVLLFADKHLEDVYAET